MKLWNSKGFSLVQVMVAAGVLGGLSLVFMQLMKNMGQAQNFAQSKSDEIELRSSIRMILDDERSCRVSLAGDGPVGTPTTPVVFQKQNIDEEETEGMDVSLYLSNQTGDARTLKKFNGENNPGINDKSKFGKLTIKTMKLVMNNPPGGAAAPNYNDIESHSDSGVIRVVVEKKVSNTQTRRIAMNFDLTVGLSTGQSPESSGETRILGCSPILPDPPSQTTILAIHSQTTTNPSCPSGWSSLWNGYSFLLGTIHGGMTGNVDLSGPGSCLRQFRATPMIECGSPNNCDFYTPDDYSAWLSTRTSDEGGVSGADILSRISRCTVCEGTQPLITIHSQTTTNPSCPSGWSSLWNGYSFLLGTINGGMTGNVDLSGPGSCLRQFRPTPMIECSSPDNCDFYTSDDYSAWLSTRTSNEGGVSGADILSRISRCTVCARETDP